MFWNCCFHISEECKDVLQGLNRNIPFAKLDTQTNKDGPGARRLTGTGGFVKTIFL